MKYADQDKFPELVKKHFQYLIDDYGFFILNETYHPQAFGSRMIEFATEPTCVRTVWDGKEDRLCVEIERLYRPNAPYSRYSRHDVETIAEFVLQQRAASASITSSEPDELIELVIINSASVVRQYCEPLLRGDFSMWLELEKFAREKELEIISQVTAGFPRHLYQANESAGQGGGLANSTTHPTRVAGDGATDAQVDRSRTDPPRA